MPMNFIRVHESATGKQVVLNADLITIISNAYNEMCYITLLDKTTIKTLETFDEVMELLMEKKDVRN
jgi:hypothetical protein